MTTNIEPSIWAGVTRAIAAYAHALDGGRPEDVAATFVPDGVSEITGFGTFEGRDAIRDGYASFVPTAPQLHLVANSVISSTTESSATAVSSLAFFALGESGWALQMTGRYDDELRLEGGEWLFARRLTTLAP